MNFGITMEKILLIGVIAALLIGPEKLPHYAQLLRDFVGRARDYLQGARTRVEQEMGPEFSEVDWRKLDPRQYDPRRIIREALLDDPQAAPVAPTPAPTKPYTTRWAARSADEVPPYDDEAT